MLKGLERVALIFLEIMPLWLSSLCWWLHHSPLGYLGKESVLREIRYKEAGQMLERLPYPPNECFCAFFHFKILRSKSQKEPVSVTIVFLAKETHSEWLKQKKNVPEAHGVAPKIGRQGQGPRTRNACGSPSAARPLFSALGAEHGHWHHYPWQPEMPCFCASFALNSKFQWEHVIGQTESFSQILLVGVGWGQVPCFF